MPQRQDADWTELCTRLGGDAALIDEVLLAADDPRGYWEKRDDELFERTFVEEFDEYTAADIRQWPWFALIDGMQERGLLREFDWKDDSYTLSEALAGLQQLQGIDLDFEPLEITTGTIEDCAYMADVVLKPAGMGLLMIVIESDSYPITIVSLPERISLGRLIRKLGGRADLLGPGGQYRIQADGTTLRPAAPPRFE